MQPGGPDGVTLDPGGKCAEEFHTFCMQQLGYLLEPEFGIAPGNEFTDLRA